MSEPQPSKDLPAADRRLWQFAAVRDVFFIAVFIFAIWFGYYLRGIFTPLLIALALAYLFHPPITLCRRRWGMPRPLTIVLLMFVIVLALGGLAAWLVPALISQGMQFAQSLSQWVADLADKPSIGKLFEDLDLQSRLQQLEEDPVATAAPLLKAALAGGGRVANALGGLLGTTTYVAVSLGLIPVYFFFFAWRFGPMTESVKQYIPASRRQRTLEVLGRMDHAVAAFVRGRLVIAAVMGAMFAIGFWICGVPYWLLLGLAGAVLSLIPFIGGVVWPLAMLLRYLDLRSGGTGLPEGWYWSTLLGPTLVFAVVQFLEGWVLTPWIGGKAVNLDTVTVLLVVFIGGAIGGMYGLLLCVPIAACIRILMIEVILPQLRRWADDN